MSRVVVFLIIIFGITADLSAGHGGGHGGAEHINWFGWDTENPPVAWFIFNFVVLFGFLGFVLKKRVGKFFNERYENMKRQMDESIRIRDEAISKLKEIEGKLSRSDYYQRAIIEEYIDMAKKEKEDILNHAKRTARSLISSAEQTILFESLEIKKEIVRQIMRNATDKALQMVISQYTQERDRQIVEEFVDSIKSMDRKRFGYII
ncbi:MAG: ATP synthase F0 subunit B [Deltaproteobacteria bacterium]|nr:ATP synthase F0 subunit B [Deltaproteobacteria bacterium]